MGSGSGVEWKVRGGGEPKAEPPFDIKNSIVPSVCDIDPVAYIITTSLPTYTVSVIFAVFLNNCSNKPCYILIILYAGNGKCL